MYKDLTNGLFAGFCGTILSHPFDTIKSRVQSNKYSIKDAISVKNFYAGLKPPLFGIMFEKMIVFGTYEKCRKEGINNFYSGLLAGLNSTLIVTPMESIKINLQNGNRFCIKNFKPYKGLLPTIFRETPGFGIYFTTYNFLNDNYNNASLLTSFLFGSISGVSAWLFIYPSDLVKTKCQTSNNSVRHILYEIIRKNNNKNSVFKGIRNLYSGFNLALFRTIPLHGGVFLGYEFSKKYINS